MTDRINAIIVALSKDIRDDDMENTVNAIKQIKGVQDVTLHVADINSFVAESRIKQETAEKLMNLAREILK